MRFVDCCAPADFVAGDGGREVMALMRHCVAGALCALAVAACTPSDGEPDGTGEVARPPAHPSPSRASPPADDADDDTAENPAAGADAAAEAVTATFDRIVDQVAGLRDLPPTENVPVQVVAPEELAQHALDTSADALEHVRQTEAILAALHQIPEDADLSELLEEVVSLGAVGLYDPEADQAYLVAGDGRLTPSERSVVAHEVVHALQDQHFDLERLGELDDDPDAAMAFRSVVEGDAVLTEERWAETHLSEAERERRRTEEQKAGLEQRHALQELPPALVESFLAPYTAGPEFVRELRQPGGWQAVDAALADPPETMVEVLHPPLGADGFTPERPDPGSRPAGWHPLQRLSWGAFEVLLLMDLAEGHTPERPVAAAWRGGRLAAWQRGDAVAVAVAWVFASPADAARVCEVVADWHAGAADSRPIGDGLRRGPEDVLRLDCDGDTVRFAVAPDAATAAEILSR